LVNRHIPNLLQLDPPNFPFLEPVHYLFCLYHQGWYIKTGIYNHSAFAGNFGHSYCSIRPIPFNGSNAAGTTAKSRGDRSSYSHALARTPWWHTSQAPCYNATRTGHSSHLRLEQHFDHTGSHSSGDPGEPAQLTASRLTYLMGQSLTGS
jgi:hypothetical protein